MAPSFIGRLQSLHEVRTRLEKNYPDFLKECEELGGLFRALSLVESKPPPVPSPFLSTLMGYYKQQTNTFDIEGHKFGITLEDVLFLTRLRIDGQAVLPLDYSAKHALPLFPDMEIPTMVKASDLDLAFQAHRDSKGRKMALMIYIIKCFIMPSKQGLKTYAPLCELVSDPENTFATYAWGAAMLAFLQFHLEKRGNDSAVDGNAWLILCFFLVRIPDLWDCLGLSDVKKSLGELNEHNFPLAWIIEKVAPICNDQRGAYKKEMVRVLSELSDEQICWTPYANWVLPQELEEDKHYVSRLGPLFCNNFVVYHKPHKFAKQFGRIEPYLDQAILDMFNHEIKFVDNRGWNGHDYGKSYRRELQLWGEKLLCFPQDESNAEAAHNNSNHEEAHNRRGGLGHEEGLTIGEGGLGHGGLTKPPGRMFEEAYVIGGVQ